MAHRLAIRTLFRVTNPLSIRGPRLIHLTPAPRSPDKDTQDRRSLKPRSYEGTSSAYDADVAAQEDAAFNPNKTSPEVEKDTAGVGNETNPLEASGANRELSTPMGADSQTAMNTGPGKDVKKKKGSRAGSGEKRGRPKKIVG